MPQTTNNQLAMGALTHITQKLRDYLGKAGVTNITIMPSRPACRASRRDLRA